VSGFPETRGSIVAAVQSPDPDTRARGLETLAAVYWKPLYKYTRLKWRKPEEDARDLTQELFLKVVEKGFLDRFDPSKARLRTFLRVCVDGLAANEARAATRQKRGGGALHVSLDFDSADRELAAVANPSLSPEEQYEREWARGLFEEAIRRLTRWAEEGGKRTHLELFTRYDLANGERPTYAELGRALSLKTTDVTNHLAAIRRELRRLTLDVLREMTGSEEEFRREARALLGVDPG
jgi:RNA polymerase sigma factor (sigma-70 family)